MLALHLYHKSDTHALRCAVGIDVIVVDGVVRFFILFIRTIHYIRKMCSHNMLMAIKREKFKTKTDEEKKMKSEIKLLLYALDRAAMVFLV